MTAQILPDINEKKGLEIGLFTIGDHLSQIGLSKLSAKDRLKQIVELAELAEDAGLDIFQVGESHQSDFISQAHLTLLAAIASRTSKIKLASAATTISTADPIHVFEQAATIDLLSDERMELVCGRAARTGGFETMNYSLDDYEDLFETKFEALLKINTSCQNLASENSQESSEKTIFPRPERLQAGLPIWQANAGTLQSALEAARRGVPLHLMHLNGEISHYENLIQAYRQEAKDYGHGDLPVATAGFLMAKSSTDQAIKSYYPRIQEGMSHISTAYFDSDSDSDITSINHLMNIGSPDLIIEKILNQYEHFNHDRYVGQIDFAGTPMDEIKETIYWLGEKVIPEVTKYTAK